MPSLVPDSWEILPRIISAILFRGTARDISVTRKTHSTLSPACSIRSRSRAQCTPTYGSSLSGDQKRIIVVYQSFGGYINKAFVDVHFSAGNLSDGLLRLLFFRENVQDDNESLIETGWALHVLHGID
jgi:hypothetical protein